MNISKMQSRMEMLERQLGEKDQEMGEVKKEKETLARVNEEQKGKIEE